MPSPASADRCERRRHAASDDGEARCGLQAGRRYQTCRVRGEPLTRRHARAASYRRVRGLDIAAALGRLPGSGKKGRKRVKKAFNGVYARCEEAGLIPRMPAFVEDYGDDYPELRTRGGPRRHPRECERLLAFRSRITDMSALGGQYTERGIHTIQWKAFMLKSGTFIEENCASHRRPPRCSGRSATSTTPSSRSSSRVST